jgi:hypothetical protein
VSALIAETCALTTFQPRTGKRTVLSLLLFTGCGTQMFWERPGATVADFDRDHAACFNEAKTAYNVGSEQVYKACLRAKGWTRGTTGTGLPDANHFRGIEDDDQFGRIKSQEEQAEQMKQEQASKRQFQDGGAICERQPANRPPGTIYP